MVGAFLRPFQSERAEQKADEETAGISQKDGRRIEVVAQKTKDRASQRNGHHRDQGKSVQQRNYECHKGGEQCRTCRQTVQTIDQVESVGDGQHPQNRQRQSHKPWQLMLTEQYGDVQNAKTTHEQHGGRDTLDREFDIGADSVEIVIHSQQENEGGGHQNGQQSLQRKSGVQVGNIRGHDCGRQHAQGKGKENGHATQAWQSLGVQMPLMRRDGYPPALG